MDKKSPYTITVFEHQCLYVNKGEEQLRLPHDLYESLELFYGDGKTPYYTLIHNGVKFCEYVGVLQIGKYTIEVLPKADKLGEENEWRERLIGMLKSVGMFQIEAPTSAALQLKSNYLLDLYFEIFIKEVEVLLHKGLVKNYRKQDGNQFALKGALQFGKQIQHNLTHQERFFTRHTVYDRQHPYNQVLLKTIHLLSIINKNIFLQGRISALLLNFPELPDIKVSDIFFNKLQYNSKTEPYRKAMNIARLLLLNYHPAMKGGHNGVLAIMFDMNLLWEQFVAVSLKKYLNGLYTVSMQSSVKFWKPDEGCSRTIRPDIVIKKDKSVLLVVDTKWKNIAYNNVSDDDLKQMYVYSRYHNNAAVLLVYPGSKGEDPKGRFHHEIQPGYNGHCGLLKIETQLNIQAWQFTIAKKVIEFYNCD